MAVSEFNQETQDQTCDPLETLQYAEKLKNKDTSILLDKIVKWYGGKVVSKQVRFKLFCYKLFEAKPQET